LIKIEDSLSHKNIAELLKPEELEKIGPSLIAQIMQDDDSRSTWMETNKEWIKLASQVRETKSFPWPNASNVKFPLLTVACMQFHARALPNLINSGKPVRQRVVGRDLNGEKQKRAERVGTYLSFQVTEGMDEWLDEMDRMLFILPMLGVCFKKTYFSGVESEIKSTLVLPNELIVDYYAKSMARARKTELVIMDSNEFVELQRSGVFLSGEFEHQAHIETDRNAGDAVQQATPPTSTEDPPYKLYESHCWLDLDDDGYKEPYIVTLNFDGKVVRIIARYGSDSILYNESGDVQRIAPDEYFTRYIFLPDPTSSIYGLGLGSLLGPTNEATNTIINQLIDAGTLSNMQGGFLGRGMKLRGGAVKFKPGEWKVVNTNAEDIRKSIVPMPIKEPSSTLFNLLGSLIAYGERVSSVSDMMAGESPGQNQPATTTLAVLEQGLQVFSSIYKRVHRALAKEYARIYELNYSHFSPEAYNRILDEYDKNTGQPVMYGIEDFEASSNDIMPASDPTIVSQAQKGAKASSLLEKLAAGLPLNVQEVTRRVLEAEQHEDIDVLMTVPERQPDPEVLQKKAEFDHKAMMDKLKVRLDAIKTAALSTKQESSAGLDEAKTAEIGANIDARGREVALKEIIAQADAILNVPEVKNEQSS